MSVASKKRLVEELKNKKFRDAYVAEHVKTSLPIQIYVLREQRGLSQSQLAERAKTTQTVISRLEDPDYGNFTIASLLKIASALDVALLVKFVSFTRLLKEFDDTSPAALAAPDFAEESTKIAAWAEEEGESAAPVSDAEIVQAPAPASGLADMERWIEIQQSNRLYNINRVISYISNAPLLEEVLQNTVRVSSGIIATDIKLTVDPNLTLTFEGEGGSYGREAR